MGSRLSFFSVGRVVFEGPGDKGRDVGDEAMADRRERIFYAGRNLGIERAADQISFLEIFQRVREDFGRYVRNCPAEFTEPRGRIFR